MTKQCNISKVIFSGNNTWDLKFSSEYIETVVFGGGISLQRLRSFESEYITYASVTGSSQYLFSLVNV